MDPSVLIVGGGPTGKAAALFLHARGVSARLVDKAAEPTRTSNALAVNPRTLELLAPSGVTDRLVAAGRPLASFSLRRDGRTLVSLDLRDAHPVYAMTLLPQADTERLLADALRERGIEVERGVELTALRQDAGQVHAALQHADGRAETVDAALMLAADGAHSRTRELLGVGMPGSSFPESWSLVDVRFPQTLDLPEGFVDFMPHGLRFALAFDAERTHWRMISTVGDALDLAPAAARERAEVLWRSSFHVSHRLAERLADGRVAFGGDAAHLHSPVGARGMNLGIEDAAVFAACAADALAAGSAARIADYGRLRRAADGGVVRRVELLTRMARGHGAFGLARRVLPALAAAAPPLRRLIRGVAVGLDHPLRYA